jgi:hypothetical protein
VSLAPAADAHQPGGCHGNLQGIDDPHPPFKGVRGKATVKIHEDVSHNIPIAKNFILKSIGSLDHPTAKWLLTQVENGNEVILKITPTYYSTWRSAIPTIDQ